MSLPRDFTTSGPNLDIYDNGQHALFIMDMNTAIHTIGRANINLYHDASGNVYIKDSNGNDISNRLIKATEYIYPYENGITNESVPGTYTITFDDDSTVTLTDTVTDALDNNDNFDYYYMIEGILPIEIKPFS
jgi:hypothetical protein